MENKFKTPEQLRLSPEQYAALMKTLELLESKQVCHIDDNNVPTRPIKHPFNMEWWQHRTTCGTVCCLGGTAEVVGDLVPYSFGVTAEDGHHQALETLFYPYHLGQDWNWLTPEISAIALRSYLETGRSNWRKAIQMGAKDETKTA